MKSSSNILKSYLPHREKKATESLKLKKESTQAKKSLNGHGYSGPHGKWVSCGIEKADLFAKY